MITYALIRWQALVHYGEACELRSTTTLPNGRCVPWLWAEKNYFFVGSDAGGERAAAIYSLVGLAKLNDLNLQAYLTHVLERNADHPINWVEELLPWNESLNPHEHCECCLIHVQKISPEPSRT